jgi:alpha-glucosidase
VRDDPTINQKVLVVLNLSRGSDGRGKEVKWSVPVDVDVTSAKLVITNGPAQEGEAISNRELSLGKFEGRIYVL